MVSTSPNLKTIRCFSKSVQEKVYFHGCEMLRENCIARYPCSAPFGKSRDAETGTVVTEFPIHISHQ